MFLLTWVVFPAILAALCTGCGLLVDRASGYAVPRVLLLPIGFAAVIVLAALLTFFDVTSELAAPALVIAAAAGFTLAFAGKTVPLRPRHWLWPAIAAGIPIAAVAAPVVLTGHPGFTGYARIVDLAFQLDLSAFIVDRGRSLSGVAADSSYHEVVLRLLGAGYPGGTHAALGATAQIGGIDPIWAWQPFLAWMSGMLGLALYSLLSSAIRHPAGRAIAAGVAAQPTILYSYALASGIKELAVALLVGLTAALLVALRSEASFPRNAVPVATAIAAGLFAVNVGILPWALVLLAVVLGPALVRRIRERRGPALSARTWVLVLAVGVLISGPAVVTAVKLAPLLRSGGPADLGNLVAPVPIWSSLGPWLTSDHRYPLAITGTETVTAILAAVVALLILLGLARAISRRDRGLLAAGAAAVGSVAVIVWRGSDWVELKGFATSAPLLVALAFSGAAALHGPGARRWVPVVVGAVVAASILAGNALVYRATPLAPYERLAELQDLGERYAGRGPALHPSFDEYASYLLREASLVNLPDVPDDALRDPPGANEISFVEDLDSFKAGYLDGFELIVLRRGDPTKSRPPANWRLIEQTSYYDVYGRKRSPVVVAHRPQTPPGVARSARFCRSLRSEVRRAGPQARVAYAPAPDGVVLEAPAAVSPPGWLPLGPDRLARGPGRLQFAFALATAGDYAVWMRGSFGRRVAVSIDGRTVGSLRWRESYPLHYEPVGAVTLAAGEHRVDIVREGGSLLPGTGDDIGPEGITTRIGPLSLVREGSRASMRIVDGAAGIDVCRGSRPLDWIEVVRR